MLKNSNTFRIYSVVSGAGSASMVFSNSGAAFVVWLGYGSLSSQLALGFLMMGSSVLVFSLDVSSIGASAESGFASWRRFCGEDSFGC